MGQPIEVAATRLGDVVIFDTDRSVTGQDGAAFESRESADADTSFPGQLAARLYVADGGIDHVFVASNQVVVRRNGGWSDDAVADASRVISDFFLFYPDAPG